MKKFVMTALLFSASAATQAQSLPKYLDETVPVEQRIDDALSRMTLDEKIAVIHAQSKFSSPGVKRLGFPDLWTDDGPHGVRPDVLWDEWVQAGQTNDSCVAFPPSPVWLRPGTPRWHRSTAHRWLKRRSTVIKM